MLPALAPPRRGNFYKGDVKIAPASWALPEVLWTHSGQQKVMFSMAIWCYKFQGRSVGGLCGCSAASISNIWGEFTQEFKGFWVRHTLKSIENVMPNEENTCLFLTFACFSDWILTFLCLKRHPLSLVGARWVASIYCLHLIVEDRVFHIFFCLFDHV